MDNLLCVNFACSKWKEQVALAESLGGLASRNEKPPQSIEDKDFQESGNKLGIAIAIHGRSSRKAMTNWQM